MGDHAEVMPIRASRMSDATHGRAPSGFARQGIPIRVSRMSDATHGRASSGSARQGINNENIERGEKIWQHNMEDIWEKC